VKNLFPVPWTTSNCTEQPELCRCTIRRYSLTHSLQLPTETLSTFHKNPSTTFWQIFIKKIQTERNRFLASHILLLSHLSEVISAHTWVEYCAISDRSLESYHLPFYNPSLPALIRLHHTGHRQIQCHHRTQKQRLKNSDNSSILTATRCHQN